MLVVVHGTTRRRAERILAHGPDPDFIEPNGAKASGFSTYLEQGPFPFGAPDEYARAKANAFPDEDGPAILRVDVPDEIIALATDDVYFPLSQGLVQFDPGAGLEELRTAWPSLTKRIILLELP